MDSLAGRTAVVGDVASGAGEEWARKLAAEGATVVIADLDEQNGRRVLREIERAGGTGSFCRAQASTPDGAGHLIGHAVQANGGMAPAVVLLHAGSFRKGHAQLSALTRLAAAREVPAWITGSRRAAR